MGWPEPTARGLFIVNNVGMIQYRSRLGFLYEAPLPFGTDGRVRAQHFDGDPSIEVRIEGTVYNSHAAGADFRLDPVVAESLPDHLGAIIAPACFFAAALAPGNLRPPDTI